LEGSTNYKLYSPGLIFKKRQSRACVPRGDKNLLCSWRWHSARYRKGEGKILYIIFSAKGKKTYLPPKKRKDQGGPEGPFKSMEEESLTIRASS